MSDGEPSSIKRLTRCAARAPALSKRYEDRVEARFDFAVYGTRFAAHHFLIQSVKNPKYCVVPRKQLRDIGTLSVSEINLMSQRLCFANPSE